MRLHPFEDGVVDMSPHSTRSVKRRDSGGNKLVDVVSRITGNATHVTSPLLAAVDSAHNGACRGSSGSPNRLNRDYRLVAPNTYVDASALIRDGANAPLGIVVRLTTDGDNPLVTTRVRVYETAPPKDVDQHLGSVRKRRSVRAENDAAVRAVMDSCGWENEPITPVLRRRVMAMIEACKRANDADNEARKVA